MSEVADDTKARVSSDNATLSIDNERFTVAVLSLWKNWQRVEAVLRRIEPTAYELSVVEAFSLQCGTAGRNGFAELKSALTTTKKA